MIHKYINLVIYVAVAIMVVTYEQSFTGRILLATMLVASQIVIVASAKELQELKRKYAEVRKRE